MKHLQFLCAAAAREGIADGLHRWRREAAALSSSVLTSARLFNFGIQKYDALERRVLKWGSMERKNVRFPWKLKV